MSVSIQTKKAIAKGLLDIKAVFLRPDDPFTWASGIKSPIYCDNRLVYSAPAVRDIVENGFAELIKNKYPEVEALFGTSTSGIGHAAITATILNLPTGYVRSSAKDHGRNNQIEGRLEQGEKVVVVEDLISTASSAIETASALREVGADVLGIVSIFTYNMQKGFDKLNAAGFENTSLCDIETLLEVAAETGYIGASDIARIKKFRDNPNDPSWMEK